MLTHFLSVLMAVWLAACGDKGTGSSKPGEVVLDVRFAGTAAAKPVAVLRMDRVVATANRGRELVRQQELSYEAGTWKGSLKLPSATYEIAVEAFKGERVRWRGSTSVELLGGKTVTAVVELASTNRAPVLTAIGGQQVAEGNVLTLGLSASDADEDELTYSMSGYPSGASLSGSTFTWTPTDGQAGSYEVTFTVADGQGGTDQDTITITVSAAPQENRAPVLAAIGNRQVTEGTALNIELAATDEDGDGLTYRVENLPSGAALSGSTFTWTPADGQAGAYEMTFTVADGQGGSDQDTITITVSAAPQENRAPVLAAIDDRQVAEGEVLRIELDAEDADGDELTFAMSGFPAGASLSGSTFAWTPTHEQAGTYEVTFTVADGQGGTDQDTITITVSAAPQGDRDALVALYNATDGPNWKSKTGWLSDRPLGQWHGVTTDGNGRVTYLVLSNNQLSGTIPGELGNLTNLKNLTLGYNQLSGAIPEELGKLTNLEYLSLANNRLSGTIPGELGNLTNLSGLNLFTNQLTGSIPEELGNLTNLEYLLLGNNAGLSGALPDTLIGLDKLEALLVGGTELCVPTDERFQTWLAGIGEKTGVVNCTSDEGMTGSVGGTGDLDAPTNVSFVRDGTSTRLIWDPVSGADYYKIYYDDFHSGACRLNSRGNPSFCEELASNVQETSYVHTEPDDDNNYYWVVACTSGGCSDIDSENPATFIDTRPSAPTNVSFVRDGASIRLSWDPVSGADYYQIYYDDFFSEGCRLTSRGNPSFCEELASNVQETSYVHTEPDDDDNYYWVVACNSGGCSDIDSENPARRAD